MPLKSSDCQVYVNGIPLGKMEEIEFLSDDIDESDDSYIKPFDFDKEYGFSLGG